MMRRIGPESGPPQLGFFGGPKDGEYMTATYGVLDIAVRTAECLDGFYVWHPRSARYEWLEVPPEGMTT